MIFFHTEFKSKKKNFFFFLGGGGDGGLGRVCVCVGGGGSWMERRTGPNQFAPSTSLKFGE